MRTDRRIRRAVTVSGGTASGQGGASVPTGVSPHSRRSGGVDEELGTHGARRHRVRRGVARRRDSGGSGPGGGGDGLAQLTGCFQHHVVAGGDLDESAPVVVGSGGQHPEGGPGRDAFRGAGHVGPG